MSQGPTADSHGLIFSLGHISWSPGILNGGHSVSHTGWSNTFSEQIFLYSLSRHMLFCLPGVIPEVSGSLIFW